MDHALTCNTLSCRRELTDRALVTTCSHVFCIDCAQKVNVLEGDNQTRSSCPACGSNLANPDDAVITNLNPSEDYKTSILSGLSPSVIMECAGRALSFWAYQATQDICYQQYLYKTLSEKYSTLTVRLDKTVSEANTEIDSLHRTVSGMRSEQEALRRKNDELVQAYKDKSRKLLQTQELYDKAKRKAEIGLIQRAASDAVDSTLSNAAHLTDQGRDNSPIRHSGSHHGMPPPTSSARLDAAGMNMSILRSKVHDGGDGSRWTRSGLPVRASMTPFNGLRDQFGAPLFLRHGVAAGPGPGTPAPHHQQDQRGIGHASSDFGSHRSGFGGIGLTSGLKVSQAQSHPSVDVPTRFH